MLEKNNQLYDRDGISKEKFDSVRKHPFEYGFKTAINQQYSKISIVDGNFELKFQPCPEDSDVWYGDCASDALLSGKRLQAGTRTIESQNYDFPDVQFSGSHYKLIFEGMIDGRNELRPIDHSRFYSALNPMHATKVVDTEFEDFELTELIGNIGFKEMKNYEEFEIDGKLALTTVSINGSKESFSISISIFEQDDKGDIVQRYDSNLNFKMNEDGVSSNDNLLSRLQNIHVTKNGEKSLIKFEDGIFKNKTLEAFTGIIRAINRGSSSKISD